MTDHDLYVTLEPCPMCAAAISFARIRRLYLVRAIRKAAASTGARLFTPDMPFFFQPPLCAGYISGAR